MVSFPFVQGTSKETFYIPATMLALGIQRTTKYHETQIIHNIEEDSQVNCDEMGSIIETRTRCLANTEEGLTNTAG